MGKIILATDKDISTDGSGEISTEETVAMRPRPWRSRSEPQLLNAGLEPIKFIAGTEAQKRGEGKTSAEGNVYEVLYKGNVAVAKVLVGYNVPEPDAWRKILEIKEGLPEEQSRHLPEIYDIIKVDVYTTIIVMERLDPPSPHIKKILRTKELRGKELVLRNEDFLVESLRSAFLVIDDFLPDPENQVESEIFAMFESDKEIIMHTIEGELIKEKIKPEGISRRIQEFVLSYTKMFHLDDPGFSKEIADKIQERFLKYVETAPRPVAKYYSPKDIDNTLLHLKDRSSNEYMRSSPGSWDKTIQKLHEERSESVYSETPESFLYSEKYMPETKGLFKLLASLKDLGLEWSDVHANNIMERPGTRELVLIDVGFFS